MRTIAACVVIAFAVPAQQSQDAGPLLAAAREALGGDAALATVSSFTAEGSLERTLGGRNISSSLEVSCVLPEQFVTMTRQMMSRGPLGEAVITRYEGFNRDEPFLHTIAPGLPFPPVMRSGPEPTTPEEIAADRARQLARRKHDFVELFLPLFAASPDTVPLSFATGGRIDLPSGPTDVVLVTGQDGFEWRLYLDATTHLPVRLAWMGRPGMLVSRSSTVAVSSGGDVRPVGPPPAPLPADPTAGMSDVEWAVDIGDYRAVGDLHWPHRWTTTMAGEPNEDVRVREFKINPEIDERVFAVRR
jgi:hypothetical protein